MDKEHFWWIYEELKTSWRCENRNHPLEVRIQSDSIGGFTLREAEDLGPQVLSASLQSRFFRHPQHLLVDVLDNHLYVFIDSSGDVMIPEDILGNSVRTGNRRIIPGFSDKSEWVPRNLYGKFARKAYSVPKYQIS